MVLVHESMVSAGRFGVKLIGGIFPVFETASCVSWIDLWDIFFAKIQSARQIFRNFKLKERRLIFTHK